MEIFRVGLIGHREVEHFRQIEEQLEKVIEKLIDEKEFVEFYIGRNGEFDIMAASVIKRAQRDFGSANSWLTLVLPYPVADIESYEKYYNEVMIPLELNKVHYKSAISKRNEWIINNTDMLVMNVEREEGNAAKCKRIAEKLGREIVNLTYHYERYRY